MSQSVIIRPDENGNYPKFILEGSSIIAPQDLQSRLSTTIQTHAAVNIPATTGTSYGTGTWNDANGYGNVCVTFASDASHTNTAELYWSHDGATTHGLEIVIASGTRQYGASIEVPIKARYFRVLLKNTDASAHVMSAWSYLKV